MTVQELIDILDKVEDKSKDVWVECFDKLDGYFSRDALIIYALDDQPEGIIISNDVENESEDDNRIVYGEHRKEQK